MVEKLLTIKNASNLIIGSGFKELSLIKIVISWRQLCVAFVVLVYFILLSDLPIIIMIFETAFNLNEDKLIGDLPPGIFGKF